MGDAKQRVQKPQPGEALQRVLEARGARMSVADAARLSTTLLGLIQRGLIVPRKSRAQDPDTQEECSISSVQIHYGPYWTQLLFVSVISSRP